MSKLASKSGRLSRDEIIAKLNRVPSFCIMHEGRVLSLPDRDGKEGEECCTWFMDAAEAQRTFKMVVAANKDIEEGQLSLVTHGLGDVLTMLNSLPGDAPSDDAYAGSLKLQGNSDILRQCEPLLIEALKKQGLDPGCWRLPVFLATELAQTGDDGAQLLLPVFMNPHDVKEQYEKVGLPNIQEALASLNVMDVRQLLSHMAAEPVDAINPWRAVEFFAQSDALELGAKLSA